MTINPLDLIDIYRIFHSTTEYTLFSSSHGPLEKIFWAIIQTLSNVTKYVL